MGGVGFEPTHLKGTVLQTAAAHRLRSPPISDYRFCGRLLERGTCIQAIFHMSSLYATTPEIIKPMLVFIAPSWLGATVKPIIGYVANYGWCEVGESNSHPVLGKHEF